MKSFFSVWRFCFELRDPIQCVTTPLSQQIIYTTSRKLASNLLGRTPAISPLVPIERQGGSVDSFRGEQKGLRLMMPSALPIMRPQRRRKFYCYFILQCRITLSVTYLPHRTTLGNTIRKRYNYSWNYSIDSIIIGLFIFISFFLAHRSAHRDGRRNK